MSTNKKFRIQNGADIVGELSINDVTVIDADGKIVAGAIADAVADLTASDIADLQSQVTAILGTSPETLDTLQEIVNAFQDADTNLVADVASNTSDIATINTTLTSGVATTAQGAKADTAVQPEDFFTVADGTTTSYLPDYTSHISSTSLSTSSASSHANWNHARLIKDMSHSENGNVIAVYGSMRNETVNGSYLPGQTNSGGSNQLLNHWVVVWDNQGNYIHSYDMGIVNDTSTFGTINDDRTHYSADVTDTHIFIGTHYGNIPGAATGSQYAVFEISNPTVAIAQGSAGLSSAGQTKIRVIGDKLITSSQGNQLHEGNFSVKEWMTGNNLSSPIALGQTNNWDTDKESGWLYSSPRGSSITGYNFKTNQSAPIISGIQGYYGQVSVGNKYVVVSDNEYNVDRDVRVFDVGTSNEVTSISNPGNTHHWGGGVYTEHKMSTISTHGDAVVICAYNQSPRTRTHYLYDMSSATPNQHVNSFSGANIDGARQVVELTGNNTIVKTMHTPTQRFGTVLPTIDYMSIAVSTVITPNVDASTIASKVYVDNAVANADPDLSSYPNTTEMTSAIATAKTEAQTYADGAVANAIDAAPANLDTLNELAAALNDDANFASTMTSALAGKATTSDLQTLQDSLGISTKLYVQDSAPQTSSSNEIWIDSTDGSVHKSSGSGISSAQFTGITSSTPSTFSHSGNTVKWNNAYGSQLGASWDYNSYDQAKIERQSWVEFSTPVYLDWFEADNMGSNNNQMFIGWLKYEDGTTENIVDNYNTWHTKPGQDSRYYFSQDKKIAGIIFATSGYYSNSTNHGGKLHATWPQYAEWTQISSVDTDLSGYSTTAEMNSAIATAVASADIDLSGYSTTAEMNSAITAEVANVVDAAPAALDTLNELAAALGDDANFASTVTASIATKASTSDLATKANVSETGLVGELIVPSTETSISYQGEVEGPTYVARLSETSAGDVSVYNINDMETSLFDTQMFPFGAAESISWITSKYDDSTVLPTQTSTSGTYAVGVYRTNQEVNDYPSRTVFNASSNSFIRRLRITDLVKGAQGNGYGTSVQIHVPKAMARALPGYSYHSGNANLVVSGSLVNDAWRSQGENGFAWKVMSGEDGMWVGDKDKSSLYYYHQVSIYPYGHDTYTSSNYGAEFQYQGMYRSPTEALHKTSNMGYRVTYIGQYTDTNETPFSSMNNFAHNWTTIGRCAIIMSDDGSKKLWVHNPHATPGIVASVSFDGPSDATSDFGTSMVSSPDNKWLLIGDGVSVWFYDVSNIDWSSKDSTSVPSIAPVKISKETFEDENGENAFAPLGYNGAKNGFAARTNVKGGKGSLFLTNTEAFVGTDSYVIRFDLTDLTKTPDQLSVPSSHTVTDIMVSDNVIHIQTDAPSNDSSKAMMSKDLTDIPITGAAIYGAWPDVHTDGLYNSNNLLQVSSDVDLYSNTTIGLNMSIPVTSIGTVTESIIPSSSLTKAINYLENKSVDLSGYSTTEEMNTAIASADVDLSGYSTTAEMNTAIAAIPATDLTPYSTTSEMNSAITAEVANVVDAAPAALDTLNELAAALGDDANFASTVTASIATKASQTDLDANTAALATKADVTALVDKASQVDLTAETTRATSAETINNQAIAILQNQVSGISTSSGSTDIEMQANVDMATNKISNLGTPTTGTDAATKAYVDSGVAGVDLSGYTETSGMTSAIATAKSEAISTASADATSKADQAEVDAKAYADQVVAATVDAAPAALDTLNELAAALGDDANFASTVTSSIATKADDAATTAALATKADDAATTTALDTKADVTTVTALDVSIKGSEPAPGPELMGDVTVSDLDGGQSSSTTHSSGGIQFARTGVEVAIFNFATEIGKEYEVSSFRGMSPATGNNRLAVVPSGFVPTVSNYWANNILKNASGTKTDLNISSSTGTQSESGTFIATTTTVQIIFFGGSMDETHYIKSISVKELSFGILDTTATHVIPAINELHTELNALSSTQSGDVSTLTSDISDLQTQVAGISVDSDSQVVLSQNIDMSTKEIKNAWRVQADDLVADRLDLDNGGTLNAKLGTVDFEGSIVNFSSASVGGLGSTINDQVDVHLNKSTANTGEFVKWNGTDYEWTELLSGRLATDQLQVASGGSISITGPGGTFDFQDGIVMLSGSDVRVDTPTDVGQAANKGYVDGVDSDLTVSLAAETSARESAVTSAISTASADATVKADAAEADAKAYADQVVAATVDAAPAALDTLNELAAALGDDANFSATVTTSIGTKANQTSLDAETSARSTADSGLQSNIDGEETARIAGDSDLQSAIDAEIVARTTADTTETSARIAGDSDLQSAIDSLTSTQSSDQVSLQSQITAEVARASSAEAVNAANIVSETSARSSADAALESDIIGLQNQVGTIISGSPASLDTLVEIVSAFENADSDLSGVITANGGRLTTAENNITALETDLSAEENARGAGDTALGLRLDSDKTALDTAIATETSGRIAGDSDLSASISAEETARIAGDASLQSAIDALTSSSNTAISSETTARTSAVSTETAARIAGDASLQSAIDAEVSRATGAESGLQTQISNILSNTDATALNSLAEIVAEFQNADSTLTGVVGGHGTRLTSLESGVSAIESWTTDNLSEGTNKFWTPERTKSVLTGGLCITYNSTTGTISIDETEAASALHVASSGDANALGNESPSHYRIDVYDVNGTIVN